MCCGFGVGEKKEDKKESLGFDLFLLSILFSAMFTCSINKKQPETTINIYSGGVKIEV